MCMQAPSDAYENLFQKEDITDYSAISVINFFFCFILPTLWGTSRFANLLLQMKKIATSTKTMANFAWILHTYLYKGVEELLFSKGSTQEMIHGFLSFVRPFLTTHRNDNNIRSVLNVRLCHIIICRAYKHTDTYFYPQNIVSV